MNTPKELNFIGDIYQKTPNYNEMLDILEQHYGTNFRCSLNMALFIGSLGTGTITKDTIAEKAELYGILKNAKDFLDIYIQL